jgi:hypothetical protein
MVTQAQSATNGEADGRREAQKWGHVGCARGSPHSLFSSLQLGPPSRSKRWNYASSHQHSWRIPSWLAKNRTGGLVTPWALGFQIRLRIFFRGSFKRSCVFYKESRVFYNNFAPARMERGSHPAVLHVVPLPTASIGGVGVVMGTGAQGAAGHPQHGTRHEQTTNCDEHEVALAIVRPEPVLEERSVVRTNGVRHFKRGTLGRACR